MAHRHRHRHRSSPLSLRIFPSSSPEDPVGPQSEQVRAKSYSRVKFVSTDHPNLWITLSEVATKKMKTPCLPFSKYNDDVRAAGLLTMVRFVLVSFLMTTKGTAAFVYIPFFQQKSIARASALHEHRCKDILSTTPENDAAFTELFEEIERFANELWAGEEMPRLDPTHSNRERTAACQRLREGEAKLPNDVPVSERGEYFRSEALRGCPKAQHSYGLLLWSGFAGVEQSPEDSARFHAAAACQHHLDGMAVFGGCMRTGTGIKKKDNNSNKPKRTINTVALGLKAIDFCASVGNPTGVNKQAALLESNGDDSRAVELYELCWKNGRANALLLFNLGWCLVNGRGVGRVDRARGVSLWKEAVEMAPDEGSEEAAWSLYQEYDRDDPKEAQRWLDLSEELGYCE